MSTQNHSSLQMHIEDPQSKVTTDSQSNGSWSIEAKIGLAGLVLAVVIPLIGFIMRKRFWPSMIAILDRASHGSQAPLCYDAFQWLAQRSISDVSDEILVQYEAQFAVDSLLVEADT
ncbi:hypothetical protein HDK64DRAFT_334492 [Phyllosticta capitalensis]